MDKVAEPTQLRQRIGPVLLTLYGVGVMVGAGIYVLVGTVAANAGLFTPLAFLLAGLIAAPTALSYAELSVRIPESAGEAAYVRTALRSKALSTTVGLAIVLVGVASAAAVLRGGVGYFSLFIDLRAWQLTVLIAMILVAIAVWGVLESLLVAALFTIVEIIGLVLVIRSGFSAPASSDYLQGLPDSIPWSGLGLATVLAFFAFIGFEDIVNLAEEVKRPSRTLPIAIIASLIITSLLYGAVSIAAVRSVNIDALANSDSPLVLVYESLGGSGATLLAAIAGVAALNGVLAQLVMAARVLFGLGRQNRFLQGFHHSHERFGTPVFATLLVGAVALTLALTVNVAALAEVTSTFLLVVFCIINVSLIVLKRRSAASDFTNPVWVPWLGLVGSTAGLTVALFG